MSEPNLTFFILQKVAERSVQHSWSSSAEPSRMVSQPVAATARFHAHQSNRRLAYKWIENPDRITSTSHACNDRIRKPSNLFQRLRSRFLTNHLVKIAHHHRVRMRAQCRAE